MTVLSAYRASPLPLKALVVGRFTVAATHLFAPRLLARLVRTDLDGTAEVYARMFGVRNAVLATGLVNLDQITDSRRFVQINVIVDAIDAGAFLVAGRRGEIDAQVVAMGTGIALTATALGLAALRSLDRG